MYTRSVIRGFIWSLYIWWKQCEEKSHLQKKTLQSCSDCCSDDAHRVFWKPLLLLGAAVGTPELFQPHGLTSEGADGNIPAHVPAGIPLPSLFSPGRQREPGIPLQRVPSVDVRGRLPPTWGWMSLICFSRPNIPQGRFVGVAEGFAVCAGRAALDFFCFSLLCFGSL